jgi:pyrroline-5-carboxylate reductase
MTQSILMVGCGNMGGALLERWAKLEGLAFTVLDPASPALPDHVERVSNADQLAGQTFDGLIVAVKPQIIDQAIPPAAARLKPGGLALSIAAGSSAEQVAQACGGAPVIRLMPNMPARVGLGVSGLYAQPACTPDDRAFATRLAEAVGGVIWVEAEDAIDRITAAAGSGPGYVFEFARTYQAAVEDLGFPADEARQLVVQTMLGALTLAADSEMSFEDLRTSITSEGGTTAAGLDALNGDAVLDARLKEALSAAYARAVELRA